MTKRIINEIREALANVGSGEATGLPLAADLYREVVFAAGTAAFGDSCVLEVEDGVRNLHVSMSFHFWENHGGVGRRVLLPNCL